jgi:glycine dehydrogenase subunit 1
MSTQLLGAEKEASVQKVNKNNHPFIPNTSQNIRRKMLETIGVDSIEELYSDIPAEVRVNHPLKVPGLNSEHEVLTHLESLLSQNQSTKEIPSFLGAGMYNHYVPAAVKAIVSRVEFQTAYTPYQAEISQGLLQALFEFQSIMADLTGMEVVNSSLYDGSNAIGEAIRMAARSTGRRKILVPKCIHPDRLSVVRNYSEPGGIRIETVDYDKETGHLDIGDAESKLDKETAALYYEVPSFFGTLDTDATSIPDRCHSRGALAIVGFDPISLGGLKGPGDYNADIAVAEGQSVSTEMNYGGPLLGIIGCRGESLVRQLPGRIIGQTTTLDGQSPAYSMVLQTREQHIRRERATSNICTNEALLAIGAAVYLSLLGPHGLKQLFETIKTKTEYAMMKLSQVPGLTVPRFKSHHYQEFVVAFHRSKASKVNSRLLSKGIHGGRVLTADFPDLGESSLLCVTETTSQESIDLLSEKLEEILGGN